MSFTGIRVRYDELMALLSIFKGNVSMNQNSLEKCKTQVSLLDSNLKFELNTPLVFSFLHTFRDEYKGNKSEIC